MAHPDTRYNVPINVKPGRRGYGQGEGICVSDQNFLSNARGLGVEKTSNKVECPHPGNTK